MICGAARKLAGTIRNFIRIMKKYAFILTCFILALCGDFSIDRATGQILANDDAGVYTNWASGENSGFGFGPWVMYNTGGAGGTNGYAGTFLGKGDVVGSTNGNYWGSYANQASTAATEEFRAF